jgi:hypothetical protein
MIPYLETTSADDLDAPLWGCRAIAKEIQKTERATFHLLALGHIPASKVGVQWVTTRRRLRAALSGTA